MNDGLTLTLTGGEYITVVTVIAAILVGLAVSFAVAYINHHYTLSTLKKLGAKALHGWLIAVTALFTGLQYYIPVLQQHLRVLESWPYIGGYAAGIYAAANAVYALKAKGWWNALLNTSTKLEAKLNAVPPTVPVPGQLQPQQDSTESAANFVG